ncbi:MAG: hypothetical protein ACJ79S_20230 [Gemmatimonadaceae bacterium]
MRVNVPACVAFATQRRELRAAPRLFAWHQLSPHAWLAVGNGGNSVVAADGADVLLVDAKELG